MAKMLVNQSSVSAQYTEQMGKLLSSSELDHSQIDRLIATKGLENILTNDNMRQYFRIAHAGYLAITDSFNVGKSLASAAPDPADYRMWWGSEFDTHRGAIGVDYLPPKLIFNTRALAQFVPFNEREAQAYHVMMNGNPPPQGDSSSGAGNYSGSGSGGGKALATNPNTKNLGPPPGMGGGGYSPGGGFDGGYGGGYGTGGFASDNMNFFPAAETNWITQNISGIAGADFFPHIIGFEQMSRSVTAYGVERMNYLDQQKQNILTQFNSLDLGTDEGRRAQFVLMQQASGIDDQKREIMDKMMQIRHKHDEFITLAKGLIEKEQESIRGIIANTRIG